jgi:hypothetical protein
MTELSKAEIDLFKAEMQLSKEEESAGDNSKADWLDVGSSYPFLFYVFRAC